MLYLRLFTLDYGLNSLDLNKFRRTSGETNELRNRYMLVDAPEELTAKQVRQVDRTSTEQPTVQVTEQVRTLLLALSNERLYKPRFRGRFSQSAI